MRTYRAWITALALGLAAVGCTDGDATIKVFKYDGSVQCEGGGVPLDEMRQELVDAGIDVLCAQKGHDGLARPAVCGAGTGDINIYVIRRVNLPDAETLGFRSVLELSEYQDQPCVEPPPESD